ncbi:HET-domain-containing protein [Paramyrothecium foliicola]|nr:HET-domain-containing protein [Paramyrothecium foliicola]
MDSQTPHTSGTQGEQTLMKLEEEHVISLLDSYGGGKWKLEIPSLLPALPIIRPPEECEKMEQTNLKDFPYQELPTRTSIRLLKMLPGEQTFSDFGFFCPPVRCSVIVVDLDDNPAYDALSYTWGDPCTLYLSPADISPPEAWAARAFEIEIDGRAVSVTTNLYTALLALRHIISNQHDPRLSRMPRSTGYLWVDALCINQKDINEKNRQVTMMSRIYHQASLVLAWLGGSDKLSRQTIQDLGIIASLRNERTLDATQLRDFDIKKSETYQALGIPELRFSSWIGLFMFLHRAWFKRAWIVQEAVLARDLWFLCGKQICNFEAILMALETLEESRWYQQLNSWVEPLIQNYRDEVEDEGSTKIALALSDARLYRSRPSHKIVHNLGGLTRQHRISLGTFEGLEMDGSAPKRPSLLALLKSYRSTEAGDVRDKVYAFIGLSLEQQTNPLRVDYRLSAEEVLIEATQHVLASTRKLNIFALIEAGLGAKPNLKLPSWVPDLSVPLSRISIDEYNLFSASKGLGSLALQYLVGNKLQLRGVQIGIVRSTGPQAGLSEALLELPLLLDEVKPPKGQTVFEVLWRTLLLDTHKFQTPATKECGDSFLEWIQKLEVALQTLVVFHLKFPKTLYKLPDESLASAEAEAERTAQRIKLERARERLGLFHTAIQHINGHCMKKGSISFPPDFVRFENMRKKTRNRVQEHFVIENFHEWLLTKPSLTGALGDVEIYFRSMSGQFLFTTDKGHLGLYRGALEVGDEIWALAGGSVPLILRPVGASGEEWRLLGEAYVHGAMQGELVADRQDIVRTVVLV